MVKQSIHRGALCGSTPSTTTLLMNQQRGPVPKASNEQIKSIAQAAIRSGEHITVLQLRDAVVAQYGSCDYNRASNALRQVREERSAASAPVNGDGASECSDTGGDSLPPGVRSKLDEVSVTIARALHETRHSEIERARVQDEALRLEHAKRLDATHAEIRELQADVAAMLGRLDSVSAELAHERDLRAASEAESTDLRRQLADERTQGNEERVRLQGLVAASMADVRNAEEARRKAEAALHEAERARDRAEIEQRQVQAQADMLRELVATTGERQRVAGGSDTLLGIDQMSNGDTNDTADSVPASGAPMKEGRVRPPRNPAVDRTRG